MREKRARQEKEAWILTIVFIILSCVSIFTGILLLGEIKAVWVRNHLLLCAFVYATLVIGLYGFGIVSLFFGRKSISKILLTMLTLVAFSASTAYLLQKTGFFAVFNDEKKLQEYLQRAGIWMPILYVLLQFLQVVLLPIPSLVSTVAGIALFGPFWTSVYSFVGIMLGSLLAFYIGRRWGQKTVAWAIGKETLAKWQKKLKGKDNLLLSAMFILPLFPDDVLCFLAGLSSMSNRYFLIIISLSRFVAITSTCYSVNFIPFDTWWGAMIWGIIIFIIVFSCVYVYRNMDKLQKKIRRIRQKKPCNREIK